MQTLGLHLKHWFCLRKPWNLTFPWSPRGFWRKWWGEHSVLLPTVPCSPEAVGATAGKQAESRSVPRGHSQDFSPRAGRGSRWRGSGEPWQSWPRVLRAGGLHAALSPHSCRGCVRRGPQRRPSSFRATSTVAPCSATAPSTACALQRRPFSSSSPCS